MTIFEIIVKYREAFVRGLLMTLALASIAWGLGLGVGIPLGALASRNRHGIGYPLHVISFMLAAVPPIVLLYWAHYPLQAALEVVINPFITAAAILSLLNVVVVAQIIRSALDDFRVEYKMAARVNGMTKWEAFRYIEFPLVFRQVLPGVLASQVIILQSTLFASLISVDELFRVAQKINSAVYRPIQIYSALAVFFLLVCLPLYVLAFVLRRRFLRAISET